MKNIDFNPNIEFQSPEIIKQFQEIRLKSALQYLQNNSPFYRRLFADNKIDIEKITKLEDLHQIPFTEKHHLQEYNKEFICVPQNKIIDYITTSGTLGTPITFAMSEKDLERLAYNEAISFSCAGGNSDDIYQLMTTIDKRFMAGLAYFMGIRMLGAGIIRVGNGIPELQWDTINRINPNAIICVPSFILRIIQYAEENGIDYKKSSVTKAICIGESLRNQDFSLNLLGQKIKSKWDIELYSTYASTEMSTTFTECRYGNGGHHHPELIIVELIDKDGNSVKAGEAGELTITTLGVEAMPLLRFKTGDIARFHEEPCQCGRKTKRIGPIIGRTNHLIKFKGTSLYPSSIFDVLDNIDYVENYIVEVSDSECDTDNITVFIGSTHDLSNNIKELKDSFRAKLRVAPDIKFMDISEITKIQAPDKNRKPTKFIDKRKSTTI